jgi:hypothetical protein
VKKTLQSTINVKEELKLAIHDTRLSDVADQLEAHSAMLSPALQQRLGVTEEVAHDPNNPINKSIDMGVKLIRQLSVSSDDRPMGARTPGSTVRKRPARRLFSVAPVACQNVVMTAVRQVYRAMDTDGFGQLNAVHLRHGLVSQGKTAGTALQLHCCWKPSSEKSLCVICSWADDGVGS